MHIGFRYHVASLVAIFFSLVLGMLIGSALFQDDGLVQEQGYMITDLENRFKALEIRTKTLQDSLDMALEKETVITGLWDQVKTVFVSGRLQGYDVVLYSNEEPSNFDRLSNLLVDAGANFYGTLELPNELAELEAIVNTLELEDTQQPIAIVYAKESPISSSSLNYLHSKGWQISIIQPYDSIINANEFIQESLVIAGIDTPVGELALIQALSQSLTGRFGWGKEFSSLLPALDME